MAILPIAANIQQSEITYKTTPTIKPFKQDLALAGYSFFHTIYKINPTIGIKNDKTAKPALGASSALTFELL